MLPLLVHSWPKAIIHIDGDSFFASCLQAIDPKLRGKPLVVGSDRGIATAVSIEAKQKGILRTMSIYQIKKLCPECIIVNSDYELYQVISQKMINIMRKYTPYVEAYSIDEAFADITGLRRVYHASYEDIAAKIKNEITSSLSISVSLGLSVNKSLAKLGSNHKKPNGFCVFSGKDIHLLLRSTPIDAVWGIGHNTGNLLKKYGIVTAYDFAIKSQEFVGSILSKPGIEIWQELNGESIMQVNSQLKDSYKSISKIRTFPPSKNPEFLYAHLLHNLETVCAKARRFKLMSKKISFFLKGQDFKMYGAQITLPVETSYPVDIAPHLKKSFYTVFSANKLYRATFVALAGLVSGEEKQHSLFESSEKTKKIELLFDAVDALSEKYGSNTVTMAETIRLGKKPGKRELQHPFLLAKI